MGSEQIVTCGGMDCSVCSVLAMVSAAFRLLLGLSAALAVLLLVISGLLYIFSTGDEQRLIRAKRTFWFSIFGFVLALVSFVSVLSLYYFSGAQNAGGWYQIQCNADGTIINSVTQNPINLENTSYLENGPGQIINSGNVNEIVTGNEKIIRFNAEEIDPVTLASDIQLLDPNRSINFFAGEKGISDENIIDFRNITFGFDKDKLSDFQIQKGQDIPDTLTDPQGNIRPILSISTTDADGEYIVTGGEDIQKILGKVTFTTDEKGLENITEALKKVAQTSGFGGKDIYAYVSGSPVVLGTRDDNCINSGGEIIEFSNTCMADKESYENRNIKCSNVYEPVTGCKCPSGFYLQGETCVRASDLEKGNQQTNGNQNSSQEKTCKDLNLEEHKCPESPRCEWEKMVNYPVSVKDTCLDSPTGPQVTKKSCVGVPSTIASENQKCLDLLNKMSPQELSKKAMDDYNKNKQASDWYDKILEDAFGKGSDVQGNDQSNGSNGSNNNGGSDNGGTSPNPNDSGPLPPDKGALGYNPTPTYEELKKCIGLPDDQIPYNGILVALLNPADPLNRNHNENVGRMFYLARDGTLRGKNGADVGKDPNAGGQEYGARTFDKGWGYNGNYKSMWGRGWKIFKGPTVYTKKDGSFTDPDSFGSQNGYKTGTSENPMSETNLKGGKVSSVASCGEHVGFKSSSAGCATMGNKSRRGFINMAKSYMTQSNGTIMQINLVGELNPSNGKFGSPDCGKIDYCSARRSFQNNGGARQFRNDPNEGYSEIDKRKVECPMI